MNLYLTKTGQYAGTMKDAGKGHMAVDVPTDKAGLLAYLNGLTPVAVPRAPDEFTLVPVGASGSLVQGLEDDPVPVGLTVSEYSLKMEADGRLVTDYQSPLSARTVIAGIDAGMVSQAVAQFDGTNLAKVATATIERMRTLATAQGLE